MNYKFIICASVQFHFFKYKERSAITLLIAKNVDFRVSQQCMEKVLRDKGGGSGGSGGDTTFSRIQNIDQNVKAFECF